MSRGLGDVYKRQEDEFVCTLRMPLSDAVQKVMDGTFRDGKTALALLMVQQLLSAPCKQ